MGYLLHLLAALLAQGLAETGWTTGWQLPWAVALLALVPYGMAWGCRRSFLAGRFRASSLLLRVMSFGAPVLHWVAVCAFGWTKSLGEWSNAEVSLAEWPRAGMLLALVPFTVYEVVTIDARARSFASSSPERSAWRRFHVRMFFSALVPLLAYIAITAAIGSSRILRVEIEEVALFGAAFAGILLVCLALALPFLLRNVWDTAPMPAGIQRDVLTAVATRADFRARSLLTWNTGDMMANAAIVGIGPWTRIVLFSDSLLSQLNVSELAAVFAHEIGHAARRHVLHFVVWAAGFFLLADVVAQRYFADDVWLSGGFLIAAVVSWLLAFGFVSRRFELEADLYCLDLLGDVSALIAALEKVGGHFRDVASWRHFSTAERVRFLAGAAMDPRVGERLRRRLGIWKRLGVLLLVVAAALELWTLSDSFPEDRLRADLRLGRYAAAAERARALEGLDPALSRLVVRAASLGRDAAPITEIEARARASFASGDCGSGVAWLDLGAMRGSTELEDVAWAAQAMIDREADPGELLEPSMHESWKVELDACRRRPPTGSSPGEDQ